jgi:hypothetical protein
MPGLSDCGVEMLMWLFLKNHPACFLLREQREEDEDGNEPNHFCFPFRGASLFPALAALWLLTEQLCVFACGTTIEDATRTPMWFYTSAVRRMNAKKVL